METTPLMPPPPPALYVDENMKISLYDAARWAKFLAVVGFIFIALLVVGGILSGMFMGKIIRNWGTMEERSYFSVGMMTIFYIILAIIYFFPCLYLFQFGNKTRRAIRQNDLEAMRHGFVNLHAFYRFVGILTIIWLIIYILALAGIIIGSGIGYNMRG